MGWSSVVLQTVLVHLVGVEVRVSGLVESNGRTIVPVNDPQYHIFPPQPVAMWIFMLLQCFLWILYVGTIYSGLTLSCPPHLVGLGNGLGLSAFFAMMIVVHFIMGALMQNYQRTVVLEAGSSTKMAATGQQGEGGKMYTKVGGVSGVHEGRRGM